MVTEWSGNTVTCTVLGEESLDIDTRVRDAALKYLQGGQQQTESAYWPFAGVAEERGSTGDPTLEPSPFFTTMHGYATPFAPQLPNDGEGATLDG